ncbi:MAG: primosomal replication protein N [Tepidimonas sp.]|nr:primosomal replication protein N [Tepidimonas sp.]
MAAAQPLPNRLQLQARLAERTPLRYTPAGMAAQDVVLEHESMQVEAGGQRLATLRLKAVAFGVQAEQLAKLALGSELLCQGFLVSAPRGRHVVFHIQAFRLYQESDHGCLST